MSDVADPAKPTVLEYPDPPGRTKYNVLYAVTSRDGGRLGLLVRAGRKWATECDRGCDSTLSGCTLDDAEDALRAHWTVVHGWTEAAS